MTTNELRYWELQEQKRANQAKEDENYRHNYRSEQTDIYSAVSDRMKASATQLQASTALKEHERKVEADKYVNQLNQAATQLRQAETALASSKKNLTDEELRSYWETTVQPAFAKTQEALSNIDRNQANIDLQKVQTELTTIQKDFEAWKTGSMSASEITSAIAKLSKVILDALA